jgi:hypothetical protein
LGTFDKDKRLRTYTSHRFDVARFMRRTSYQHVNQSDWSLCDQISLQQTHFRRKIEKQSHVYQS